MTTQCTETTVWELVGGTKSAPIQCAYVAGHSGDHLFSVHDESDAIRYKLASDERDSLRADLARVTKERDIFAKACRDIALTEASIAAHVADRLDWDRSNDAALYAIADDIASGAWRTWERK